MLSVRVVLVIVLVSMLAACSDSVSLSNEDWQCKGMQCEVSFLLSNLTEAEIEARYAIRAQSAVQTINSDMSDGLVVGEIKQSVVLAPGASQQVHHQLETSRTVTNMKFNAWVK